MTTNEDAKMNDAAALITILEKTVSPGKKTRFEPAALSELPV